MALPSDLSPTRPPIATEDWRFSLNSISDCAGLEQGWRALEALGDTPFFLSWDWIGCWLKSVPREFDPALLKIEQAGRVIGLAIVTRRTQKRLGLMPYRSLSLHETGDRVLDSLTIEYNGALAEPALHAQALTRAAAWLLASHADELHISGIASTLLPNFGAGLSVRLRDRKPTYAVDLAHIKAAGGNFAASLSANTRSQLRRALRQYEALGPLRITQARSREEAQDMLSRMIPLHQTYWQGRDKPGAFADPRIVEFHRRLIDDSFMTGHIQILRCDAGPSVIGYLYNFTRDGRAYSYQSGIDYDLLPRGKAGWVCHALTIEENLKQGMATYDLLAGESQFKASFGKQETDLVWVTVERNGWSVALRKRLRAVKAGCTDRILHIKKAFGSKGRTE